MKLSFLLVLVFSLSFFNIVANKVPGIFSYVSGAFILKRESLYKLFPILCN